MVQSGLSCSGVIIADAGRIHDPEPGQPKLSDIFALFGSLFDDVILVAADPAAFLDFDALIVSDQYSPISLWSGIHAGLFAARHAHAFVAACGLPVTSVGVVDLFRGAVAPRYDAVLPAGDHAPLPLPGVYGKSCLKPLARQLAKGDANGQGWLRLIRVHTLGQDLLRKVVSDPDSDLL